MNPEDLKNEVVKAVDAADAEPTAAKEDVTPVDVKPVVEEPVKKETETRPIGTEEVTKLSEQVGNLNVALKQEREEKKALEAKLKEFGESTKTLDKLKSVFVEPEKAADPVEKTFLTKEELDSYLEQKKAEDERQLKSEQLAKSIKEEVSNLEKEWDGSDGKPQYIDEEVYKWQKANDRLYLRPTEAFEAMKKQELIDYEVSKRLAGKPEVKNVGKTGGVQEDVKSDGKTKIMSEQELRGAISEIFENANSGNNN